MSGFMGDSMDISDFLQADISGKLILAFSYTDLNLSGDSKDIIKFYKVSQRNQVTNLSSRGEKNNAYTVAGKCL